MNSIQYFNARALVRDIKNGLATVDEICEEVIVLRDKVADMEQKMCRCDGSCADWDADYRCGGA
jgi:hypothetical protein